MQENLPSMPKVSICVVAKDEALTIDRALESLRPIAFEYIVAVDDKTQDDTYEIVEKFKERHPDVEVNLFHYTWEGDFSKARNNLLNHVNGDWIFILDAHEYLQRGHAEQLMHILLSADQEVRGYGLRLNMEPIFKLRAAIGNPIPECWFVQMRVFRYSCVKWEDGEPKLYQYGSHNHVRGDCVPASGRRQAPEIILWHHRPIQVEMQRRQQRKDMNIPVFANELENDADSGRGLYYQAMSCVNAAAPTGDRKEFDFDMLRQAIPHAEKYLELYGETQPDEGYEMAMKIGEAYSIMKEWEDAKKAFERALLMIPVRAEAYLNLGQVCLEQMSVITDEYANKKGIVKAELVPEYQTKLFFLYTEARKWLTIAAETIPPITAYYLRGPVYTVLPIMKLAELEANVYEYTKEPAYFFEAQKQYQEIINRLPFNREFRDLLADLRKLYIKNVRESSKPAERGKRVAIFDKIGSFTNELGKRINDTHDVKILRQANIDGAIWADFILSAWADDLAGIMTEDNWEKPFYVRLCGYEAYGDMPRKIDWEHTSGIITISDTMKRYVEDRFAPPVPIHVIKHGVDLERYTFKKREHGNNIAFAGHMRDVKGLMELAEIIKFTPPHVKFHLAGQVQQPDLWRAFWWRLRYYDCADRVEYYGVIRDMNQWFDYIEANYLLSCSFRESFGYVIGEAMAKGIKPVLRRSEATEEHWPSECIYDDLRGARALLSGGDYHSKDYRKWIHDKYNFDREASEYLNLINGGD